jgi:hypothetical protein
MEIFKSADCATQVDSVGRFSSYLMQQFTQDANKEPVYLRKRVESTFREFICDFCRYHCSYCANAQLPVYSVWIPLGEITVNDSILAVLPGTHELKGFENPPMGKQVANFDYLAVDIS